MRVERAIFLAPLASASDAAARFARELHIPPWVVEAMQRRFEARLGVRWADLEVAQIARSMTARLLIVHDPADREVPWHEGAAIAQAWPGASLLTLHGCGHHRIRRDPAMIEQAVAFLTA